MQAVCLIPFHHSGLTNKSVNLSCPSPGGFMRKNQRQSLTKTSNCFSGRTKCPEHFWCILLMAFARPNLLQNANCYPSVWSLKEHSAHFTHEGQLSSHRGDYPYYACDNSCLRCDDIIGGYFILAWASKLNICNRKPALKLGASSLKDVSGSA